jgi:hypothetical protein
LQTLLHTRQFNSCVVVSWCVAYSIRVLATSRRCATSHIHNKAPYRSVRRRCRLCEFKVGVGHMHLMSHLHQLYISFSSHHHITHTPRAHHHLYLPLRMRQGLNTTFTVVTLG